MIDKLTNLRRDIVSDGYDEALKIIAEEIPLTIHEYPTGSRVWDWEIPKNWTVKEAWIIADDGRELLNLNDHQLHVMSYSQPVNKRVSHDELLAHLHTREDCPNAVPFEFSYYEPKWGFCVEHNRLNEFDAEYYDVYIDAEFTDGTLKVGECYIPGKGPEIVLISHLCHPCQANDGVSSCVALIELAKRLRTDPKYWWYSHRILFVPETIGTIAYLANNDIKAEYGIAFDMLGNDNRMIVQRSLWGNTQIDKAGEIVMRKYRDAETADYRQVVSNDEKVLNAPGVDIPCIALSRAHCWGLGQMPYHGYHTSYDSVERIYPDLIEEAVEASLEILYALDSNWRPLVANPGLVCLSRSGLWVDWRDNPELNVKQAEILDRLDGRHTVIDLAYGLGLDYNTLFNWLRQMEDSGAIRAV